MAEAPEAESRDEPEGLHRSLRPVLWLSILVMAVTPFLTVTVLGRTASSLLVGGTALVALRRSNARRSIVLWGQATVLIVTAASIMTREAGEPDDVFSIIAFGLLCALLLMTPVVVVFRLGARPRITIDTVAGALAAYIQIGLFFAALFRLVELVSDKPFFNEVSGATPMDYEFFSFVTLTTLGYGNLTPAESSGQMLSLFEAVTGQVFLVTVVALAVGKLGAEIPRRRGSGAQAAPR